MPAITRFSQCGAVAHDYISAILDNSIEETHTVVIRACQSANVAEPVDCGKVLPIKIK